MAEEALAAAKSAALARLSAMQAQPGQSLPDATELLQSFPAPGSVAAPLATSTSAATPAAAAASPAQDNCRSKAVRAPQQMLRVAVQGCAHGELDNIYNTIADMERSQGLKIDLLLCCGDFQAVRFKSDLECMAVPAKFRKLGTFYRYYTGEKVAPVPTIFIGGNHEASNYLQELCHGGWAAPNIYFLGYSGVVNFRGLRIGGLSGIFKSHDFSKGHFERPPYDRSTMRSVYHVREYDQWKLDQLQQLQAKKAEACGAPPQRLDVFMTHDWPRGITRFGDEAALLRKKQFFREEVRTNTLGSTPGERLVHTLQPKFWFAAHLHVKFPAIVLHDASPDFLVDSDASATAGANGGTEAGTWAGGKRNPDVTSRTTKFLALDKCLPGRDFLQMVEIPLPQDHSGDAFLRYDPDWLAVTRATLPHFHVSRERWRAPPQHVFAASLEESTAWVAANFDTAESLRIPTEFPQVLRDPGSVHRLPIPGSNPQTLAFLAFLGNSVEQVQHHGLGLSNGGTGASAAATGPYDRGSVVRSSITVPTAAKPSIIVDANEVILDDDTEDEDEADGVALDPADEQQGPVAQDRSPSSKKARTDGGKLGIFSKLSLPPPKHS